MLLQSCKYQLDHAIGINNLSLVSWFDHLANLFTVLQRVKYFRYTQFLLVIMPLVILISKTSLQLSM
jgi:hypothetical protein